MKRIGKILCGFHFIPRILPYIISIVICALIALVTPGHATMAVVSPSDQNAGQEILANEAISPPIYPDIRIEVNLPATQMTLYENDIPIFTKPVAIGSGIYPTPEQESEITHIEWNPWWYPPPGAKWAAGEKPHPPGKGNPLGQIKMPISNAILFHGTNKEWTVGKPSSHGCMRMYNADAEEVGWYLQSKLSFKNDSALRDTYNKNRKTTFLVKLEAKVPVKLIYQPAVLHDDRLILYPDYYGKLGKKRKAVIIEQLLSGNVSLEMIDDKKIAEFVKKWPSKTIEIPIASLLLSAEETMTPASGMTLYR